MKPKFYPFMRTFEQITSFLILANSGKPNKKVGGKCGKRATFSNDLNHKSYKFVESVGLKMEPSVALIFIKLQLKSWLETIDTTTDLL